MEKVKYVEENKEKFFKFSNTHNTFVNAFRRIILEEVEVFAIDKIIVKANDSPVFNETIASRLGLIPLKSDEKKNYIRIEEDPAGENGSAKSIVKFSMKKEGIGEVYSEELKSDNPKVVPTINKMPITKMFKSDDLFECEATAILGCGTTHAKLSPAHTYLKEDNDDVNLIVEGFGQLSEKEIFNDAISIFQNKMKEVEGKL